MNNIIVFGASGQLGQCLKMVAEERGLTDIQFLSSSGGNITDKDSIQAAFEKYKPAFAINCAAYTAVDKAEDELEQARLINKTGAENLAEACKINEAVLIHISTDFVFKGNVSSPLKEDALTEPVGVYGLTKLEGEQAVAKILDAHFIIRTSWLYAEFGGNFVKTMLKFGAERDQLKVIADQAGTPTYAIDLAGAIFDIIASGSKAYGIYHYSDEGIASWYDLAMEIFSLSGIKVKVLPVTTAEYYTKATRPPYSVMDKTKIKTTFGITIPYWRDSLAVCIEKLKKIKSTVISTAGRNLTRHI